MTTSGVRAADLREVAQQTVRVERELLESCLELFEGIWLPCDDDCECVIHSLRVAMGLPDGPSERRP